MMMGGLRPRHERGVLLARSCFIASRTSILGASPPLSIARAQPEWRPAFACRGRAKTVATRAGAFLNPCFSLPGPRLGRTQTLGTYTGNYDAFVKQRNEVRSASGPFFAVIGSIVWTIYTPRGKDEPSPLHTTLWPYIRRKTRCLCMTAAYAYARLCA